METNGDTRRPSRLEKRMRDQRWASPAINLTLARCDGTTRRLRWSQYGRAHGNLPRRHPDREPSPTRRAGRATQRPGRFRGRTVLVSSLCPRIVGNHSQEDVALSTGGRLRARAGNGLYHRSRRRNRDERRGRIRRARRPGAPWRAHARRPQCARRAGDQASGRRRTGSGVRGRAAASVGT